MKNGSVYVIICADKCYFSYIQLRLAKQLHFAPTAIIDLAVLRVRSSCIWKWSDGLRLLCL